MIFVGLVVLWLLILVPAVARRQQEVARLSPALLSGRVLERPMRHRFPEVGMMERLDDRGPTTVGELVDRHDDVPSPRERDEHADPRADLAADDDHRDRPGNRSGDDDESARDDNPYDEADVTVGDDDRDDHDGTRDDARDGARGGDAVTEDADDADEDVHAEDDTYEADEVYEDDDVYREDLDAEDPDAHLDAEEDVDAEDTDFDVEDGVEDDEREWERPPAQYRPGRGGYDPEAAAVAAHAKYAFRQRVVLGLLVLLLVSVALALLVATPIWWATGVLGAGLAGYLTYLRRQVRIEEAIRDRRAARLAGTRRTAAADDPELDDWARRGRDAGYAEDGELDEPERADDDPTVAEDDEDWTVDDGEPSRIRGTGEPLGVLPARRRTTDGAGGDQPESSLPRLAVAPPPPIPAGTALVDVEDEDELDAADPPSKHRRAVGE